MPKNINVFDFFFYKDDENKSVDSDVIYWSN